jgi:alpha-tubulin suppressor-like RCC1 family protein
LALGLTITVATLTACGDLTGVPKQLAFTVQPSDAVAGHEISPAVQVTLEDISGHRVRGSTDAITLALGTAPSGAALSGTVTVNAVDGVATFSGLSINRADPGYTLVASMTGLASTTSGPFAVTAGAPAQLAFTAVPSGEVMAGKTFTPAVVVTIEDSLGNPVPSATNVVTVSLGASPGGGTLAGMTQVSATNGVATFGDLSIQRVGAGYTLAASSSGLAGASFGPFGVVAAAATQLVFTGQPSTTQGMQPITPAVQVSIEDAFGNVAPSTMDSVTISLGTNPNDGTLGGTTTVAAVHGVATFTTLTLDAPGDGYTLTAGAAGVAKAMSDTFGIHVTFAAVTAGGFHTCGVTSAGAAYCWGYNALGELGNGTATDHHSPVAVSGGLTFTEVSAGYYHTCGVTPAGAAYCWGYNASGQLGNGTTTDSDIPVAVAGGLTFAGIAAGYDHTCGVTPTGLAYCWGDNYFGPLGDGSTTNRFSPVAVSGGLTLAAVTAGYTHTCGLTPAGAAYCWGYNNYGQVGDGTTTSRTTPVAVAGGLTFAAINTVYDHTCGVTPAGAAYCWGRNDFGQLGSDTQTEGPVPVSGGLTFMSVASGTGFTCGLTGVGAAYCWGLNRSAQFGDGTFTNSITPVATSGGLTFAAVTAGYYHTCGMGADGEAYCWGGNGYGEAGDGTTLGNLVPARVVQ